MSSEIIQLNLHEKPPVFRVKDEWFDAYMEGNMRVPQTDLGIILFMLYGLLKDGHPDMSLFMQSELTIEQLQKMRDGMNAAHGHKRIPNRTVDQIDAAVKEIKNQSGKEYSKEDFQVTDQRLIDLYKLFQQKTEAFIRLIVEQKTSKVLPSPKLHKMINSPELLKTLREWSELAIEALRSKEGRNLAGVYRDNFDLKKYGQPDLTFGSKDELFSHLRSKANESKRALKAYVVQYIKNKKPELAKFADLIYMLAG